MLVGFTLLLAGIAMLVAPGPAFVVIPIGLAILSLEFSWAEGLLDRALVQGEKARQRASRTTRAQRVVTAIVCVLAVAAFATCAILYDIPLLPV